MKKATLITLFVIAAGLSIPALAGDAKENWEKTCIKCHGPDGKGQTKMGQKVGVKDFTDPKVQADFTDDKAFKSLKEGLKDPEGKVRMKPVENLSDDEVKALIKMVRAFKA
ncbi:MAG TPA: c-type cytochrome [Verrucomicrobiae bacterium]|nr:c-type cytochrome [Verrucomicrobiae bacterium]